ncbi:hypothetical protein DPMN_120741 [Dreissena polymorpha]|uniref:Uncharacterized protein n=1 Tax=Dreissena polymorpha TaxID=45954 RepID=A0A9D4GP75_DREPO|nr:hypothetical protein DPMN_120741 [Dreissena polymorpha]
MSVLDQPESDTVPYVPGVDPSSRVACIRAPENIKYGGSCCPEALPPPIRVTVWDLPAVTACALKALPVTILGGL